MSVASLLGAFDPFETSPADGPSAGRRYLLLDVFTDQPLQGNQLAVFTDGTGLAAETMQAVAREMKLSESVFVLPAEGGGDVRVRIFTPGAELPFAGHPVLGTAAVVGGALGRQEVVLETGAGPVEIRLSERRGLLVTGSMDQPIPTWEPFAAASELLDAVGVERSELPVEVYCNGPRHVYVALASHAAVAALEPDTVAIGRLGEYGINCFAVEHTGAVSRVKTRMFGPAMGVAEDPATGSAAGPLAVHLARHGHIEFGQSIEIEQGAEIDRPSSLRARAEGSAERLQRVVVEGEATIVGRGELWPG
jgi:trans-2,3-dihydro-3-hydroxyanthranilate isomerase